MPVDATDIIAIVEGYAQGHFLMAETEDAPVEWYYTNRRTLIPLDDRFHCPKSLRRVINQNRFTVKINTAFREVVAGCADRDTTWISRELQQIYWRLHQAGWAHSFETWQGNELAGGILGIAINSLFVGESMFYRITNASKVALVKLVEHLRQREFHLFDAQLMNPHLARFGAYEVSDYEYRQLLGIALTHKPNAPFWQYTFQS
ncbi:MAG: leucyl/phenylalanyl-tRNA--protein transferase [Pseudanabaenaceae cyanobacterium]